MSAGSRAAGMNPAPQPSSSTVQSRPHLPLHQTGIARHCRQGPRRQESLRCGRRGDRGPGRKTHLQQTCAKARRQSHPLQRARHADFQQSKRVDEFVNTWSIEGFREEGTPRPKWAGVPMKKRFPSTPSPTRKARKTRSVSPAWVLTHGCVLGSQLQYPWHGRPSR